MASVQDGCVYSVLVPGTYEFGNIYRRTKLEESQERREERDALYVHMNSGTFTDEQNSRNLKNAEKNKPRVGTMCIHEQPLTYDGPWRRTVC
jgi:hypothetical protein